MSFQSVPHLPVKLTLYSESLVANYFPKMMMKCASWIQQSRDNATGGAREQISFGGNQVSSGNAQSLLD